MSGTYIFKSERLGFRNWKEDDITNMLGVNSNPKVMEFFPKTPSKQDTSNFIQRMSSQFLEKGYCYFAVEVISTSEFIGFIGLSEQAFEADFTPIIDIGWRLNQRYWNKGYATEGAKRCLEFAFESLKLDEVYSIASKVNVNSISVMKKIGMEKIKEFNHPLLTNSKELEKCVLYVKKRIRH